MGKKYLHNGKAVWLCREIEGGFLVQDIYEYGSDCDEEEPYGVEYFVERVFDEPPTAKMHEEVVRLEKRIACLVDEEERLKQDLRDIESVNKARFEKYKRYAQLKRLDDFLEGKITHVVFTDYRLKIEKLGEGDTKDEWGGKGIKLLTLFGYSNGNLEYGINSYKDGSGCDSTCVPVCSYDEGLQIIQNKINDCCKDFDAKKGNTYLLAKAVEAAKTYGLSIDQRYVDTWKAFQVAELKKVIEKKSAELQAEHDKLKILESEA